MSVEPLVHVGLPYDSFLEYAFVRWILTPCLIPEGIQSVQPQESVTVDGRTYRIDYSMRGQDRRFAIELDGYAFHSDRQAFTYDRLRQNDLCAAGYTVLRFSYDSIRLETARCIRQLQAALRTDPDLRTLLTTDPVVEVPEMNAGAITGLSVRTTFATPTSYFDLVREKLNHETLRQCQIEAFWALANYFQHGGKSAACVMSVGAGKTALGVVAALAFPTTRVLILTPGVVIRGTFHKALDHSAVGNVLYGLPGGPLIPGCRPPKVLRLDRDEGSIRGTGRKELLAAEIIISNFHSLGTGHDEGDLLAKLQPDDIDLVIIDEAHIAASDSYQRAFQHFKNARTILMSACFQRLDGKPIAAEVVYRYRLIDSIADGNAKSLRVRRFAPDEGTMYELIWPDGRREEIVGKEALLEIIRDERKLSLITAKSHEPIRQIMRVVQKVLDQQTALLAPIKPRVLFSALGERHAAQISEIAEQFGIPCAHLHHSMSEARIKSVRERYEQDSGDLQGIVQLKMLGQGYDFPPITVVVPMRPYGSFSEFYQFIGRGIRVLTHPSLVNRVAPQDQFLDIIYHAELGLDEHIETIYRENDMDPITHLGPTPVNEDETEVADRASATQKQSASVPSAFVLFQPGSVEQRIVHDEVRVAQRKVEREQEALALQYSTYVRSTENPVAFDQYEKIMRGLRGQ